MPYQNVPESLWDKMDRCIESVSGDPNVDNPYAVCYASIVEGKSKAAGTTPTSIPPYGPGGLKLGKDEDEDEQGVIRKVFDMLLGRAKESRRHSAKDVADFQAVHDLMAEHGAQCQPMSLWMTKGVDGQWRWVMVSSNAFEDRDREIVSQKALEADVARADRDGDYGPLLWWHSNLELGKTDFNAMHGRMLVESGTFHNATVAERLATKAAQLGGSLGFRHPPTEPDRDGVFHNIRRYERSLLPNESASNTLTALPIITKESKMDEKKIQSLKALVGDDALVDRMLAAVGDTEHKAVAEGTRTKATTTKPHDKDEKKPADEKKPTDEKKPADAMMDEEEKKKPAKKSVADLTIEELSRSITEAIDSHLLAANAAQATKEAATATAISELKQAVSTLNAKVTELVGAAPRGVKDGFRASTDQSTVADESLKGQKPAADSWLYQIVDKL